MQSARATSLSMERFSQEYINELWRALSAVDPLKLKQFADKLQETIVRRSTVFLIGNGGSAATPSHSAGDWTKELQLKAVCLTDNPCAVTAFSNDTGYDNVFRGQLEVHLSSGDLVVAYSGSGNSPNVIRAIEYAKERGVYTIGVTGNWRRNQGGELARIVDLVVLVPAESMERIEDSHLVINHIVKQYLKSARGVA